MGVNEPWRVMRMAYTSKFAELYKSTHLTYHYLCYLLVSCALGLDFLGLLLSLRIAGYYFALLLIIGIFALLSITKRKYSLGSQAHKRASFLALFNLGILFLILVLL